MIDSQRINILEFIIGQVEYFSSKITVRFHSHTSSFTEPNKYSGESQMLTKYCLDANIDEDNLMYDVKRYINFGTRPNCNEDYNDNSKMDECGEPPGQEDPFPPSEEVFEGDNIDE